MRDAAEELRRQMLEFQIKGKFGEALRVAIALSTDYPDEEAANSVTPEFLADPKKLKAEMFKQVALDGQLYEEL